PSVEGVRTCYGFHDNDFRRMQHVHGAVRCSSKGLQLLVNPYCAGRDNLRRSQFHVLMKSKAAVIDPECEEERREAWLVARDWDRFDNPPDAGVYVIRK